MRSLYPIITSKPDALPCFNCFKPTDPTTEVESGHAPGHGEYRRHCPPCNLWTWFDYLQSAAGNPSAGA